jgi:hypothetical protein
MHTTIGRSVVPSGGIFTGEGMTAVSDEIDYRMQQLMVEAEHERLAGPREGLRQHIGHALMAIGRTVHGPEVEAAARPALQGR